MLFGPATKVHDPTRSSNSYGYVLGDDIRIHGYLEGERAWQQLPEGGHAKRKACQHSHGSVLPLVSKTIGAAIQNAAAVVLVLTEMKGNQTRNIRGRSFFSW